MRRYSLSLALIVSVVLGGCNQQPADPPETTATPTESNESGESRLDIPNYSIVSRNTDGSVTVSYAVTLYRLETRVRMVTMQKTRSEERTRERNVTDTDGVVKTVTETYVVEVPYTEEVEQTYTVQVPYQETRELLVPKGKDIEQYLADTLTKLKELQDVSSFDADAANAQSSDDATAPMPSTDTPVPEPSVDESLEDAPPAPSEDAPPSLEA